MNILIVIPDQPEPTGNWVTAGRMAAGLEERGHRVDIRPTPLWSTGALESAIGEIRPEVVLLLHAFRTGAPWLQVEAARHIPFLVLLTGTDVNFGLSDPEQQPVIDRIFSAARGVLVQNRLLLQQVLVARSSVAEKLHYLPPGVRLGEAAYDLRRAAGVPVDRFLFFCPAGLRPVKQLLELVEMFGKVVMERGSAYLVIAGPVLDENYAGRLRALLAGCLYATWIGSIPHEAMASATRSADVVVNNSAAEGLSNALLEADLLGVPILANDIPGNREAVRPEVNGLLYGGEAEFIAMACRLMDKPFSSQRATVVSGNRAGENEISALEKLLGMARD